MEELAFLVTNVPFEPEVPLGKLGTHGFGSQKAYRTLA